MDGSGNNGSTVLQLDIFFIPVFWGSFDYTLTSSSEDWVLVKLWSSINPDELLLLYIQSSPVNETPFKQSNTELVTSDAV